MVRRPLLSGLGCAASAVLLTSFLAAAPGDRVLFDFAEPKATDRIKVNGNGGVSFAIVDGPQGKALEVTCAPGDNGYPGVELDPANGPWDLSSYGQVEADVTNLSDGDLTIALRVDNAGEWQTNPWNSENTAIHAGETATCKVWFGWSWGNRGFALDPSKVVRLLVFTTKPAKEVKFRVDAVRAAGKSGARPPGVRIGTKPEGGVLVDFAAGFDESRIEAKGAKVALAGEGAARHATLSFSAADRTARPGVLLKSPEGQVWDLSDYSQVELALRNPGPQAIHLVCRVESQRARGWPGETPANCSFVAADLAAGADQTVVVPFDAGLVWDGAVKGSGNQFSSDSVAGIGLYTDRPAADCTIEVLGVKAVVGPPAVLPAWVGQRPPVPGNWTVTLDDDFSGPTLDTKLWVLPEKPWASWWGDSSNNVPENGYVQDGHLVIKCERRDITNTDDPKIRARHYATSVVTTFDKWTQRYGYFEARMKLPTALGMWPAFWMMPDRGREAGPEEWKRSDTHNGGMEIDIMEALARFGPFRYNIALHWDGYGKEHQSIGTERIYCLPDKDGYITSGLLWEPGKLTFYANGRVVGEWQNERIASVPAYLMFTLPSGGWGTYGYVDDAKLPCYFRIDYVRCWQKDEWR